MDDRSKRGDVHSPGANNINVIRAILGNKRREMEWANDVNRLIEAKEREMFPGGFPIRRRKRKE